MLSMLGVYGLAAGDVSARWHELAVRMALGASRSEALRTVIRPCAVVLAAGVVLGILGAVSVGRGLSSLLHGVSHSDVPTLIVAPIFLGATGILATVLAARRVLRVDPAATLRCE